jgi:GT2 family glycosyltransferase
VSGKPLISFVIVNYNTKDLLRNCLYSIEQFTDAPYQIVVVDNASSDGSFVMVATEFPHADRIGNKVNIGFPKAVNQGITEALAPFIFVLNSDIELTKSTIPTLIDHLRNNPKTGIAGPAQVKPDGTSLLTMHVFPTLIREWLRNLFFTDVWRYRLQSKRTLDKLNQNVKVDWLMGAALLIRQKMISDIGGMDDTVFMYGEECDWAYRAQQNNWDTFFIPEALVIHHKSASANQVFNVRRYAVVTKSEYYFFAKHHGFWQLPFFVLARIIGSGLRMGISGLLSLFGVGEARHQFVEHGHTIRLSLTPSLYRWIWANLKS